MDQLTSNFERGHIPRASVVPEVVVGGSPSTHHPSQPPTPSAGQGVSGFVLPQFESNSSLESGRSGPLPPNYSATPSPETPTNLFRQPDEIASIVRDFPAPPVRSTSYPSTLSSVYPEQDAKELLASDHQAEALSNIDLPLIPPIKRLDTDFSAMTGNSYLTATEGYEIDDNARS